MGSWVCSFKIMLIGLGNGPADKDSYHCSYNLSSIPKTHLIEEMYLLLWCVLWLLHVSFDFYMNVKSYMTTHTHTNKIKKPLPMYFALVIVHIVKLFQKHTDTWNHAIVLLKDFTYFLT